MPEADATKIQRGIIPQKLQMEYWFLFSAYHLMLLHISSKIMKVSLTVQSFRTDRIFILNILKGIILKKKWWSYGFCSLVRCSCIFVPTFMKISMTVIGWIPF